MTLRRVEYVLQNCIFIESRSMQKPPRKTDNSLKRTPTNNTSRREASQVISPNKAASAIEEIFLFTLLHKGDK